MPDAAQIITSLDFSTPLAARAFQKLYDTPEGAAAALQVLAKKPAGDVLQAALAIYRSAGADPAVFRPYLKHPSPTIAVLAGCAALERGDIAGFEPLIAVLDSENRMPNTRPPQWLWVKALQALVFATGIAEFGPPLDTGLAERQKAKQRWTDWLASNRQKLRFDPKTGEWTA